MWVQNLRREWDDHTHFLGGAVFASAGIMPPYPAFKLYPATEVELRATNLKSWMFWFPSPTVKLSVKRDTLSVMLLKSGLRMIPAFTYEARQHKITYDSLFFLPFNINTSFASFTCICLSVSLSLSLSLSLQHAFSLPLLQGTACTSVPDRTGFRSRHRMNVMSLSTVVSHLSMGEGVMGT